MTQDQVDNWSQNPDQYVADEEEETFSVRVSGELVLDELLDAFPEAAVAAVASAVHKRFQEAEEAKVMLAYLLASLSWQTDCCYCCCYCCCCCWNLTTPTMIVRLREDLCCITCCHDCSCCSTQTCFGVPSEAKRGF